MTTDCSTQSAYYGYADNIAAVVISEAEISRRALPILVFVTRNVGDVQRADMRLLNPGSPLPDVRRLRRQNLRDAVAIAQVDEDAASVIAGARDPSEEDDLFPFVARA